MSREESRALRAAGLTATDVAVLGPHALVDATDGVITDERAEYLHAFAGLLRDGHPHIGPGFATVLLRLGIRHVRDLVGQTAEDLWCRWMDSAPYTGARGSYAALAKLVPSTTPEDEVPELFWRHLHGRGTPMPTRTRRRLRIPSLGIDARVEETGAGVNSIPLRPLGAKTVSTDPRSSIVVGHWMWSGKQGAFLTLHQVSRGAAVMFDGNSFDGTSFDSTSFEVVSVDAGFAPRPVPPGADLVLLTPPHRRWPPHMDELGLPYEPTPPQPTFATLANDWFAPVQVVVTCRRSG